MYISVFLNISTGISFKNPKYTEGYFVEKRCLVSRGFLFIVVILLYVFPNFVVICVTLTPPPYFRMKLDYPLFIFCYHCLVLKQNWFKVLLFFFPFGDWQKSPLFMLRKTSFWFLFQQGTLTALIFSTTLPYKTALQVTRKESTQLLAADNVLYILF